VAGRRARLAHRLRAAGLRVTPGADSGILWDDPHAPAFDAVIIDHMPPGHDAGPVLEQLAELAPDTGIVVLSAVEAALPEGCATVISKVASPRSVAAALVHAVERHDARLAARATGAPAALHA
jgi:DNA-binding NarL/FixJ family response regulator